MKQLKLLTSLVFVSFFMFNLETKSSSETKELDGSRDGAIHDNASDFKLRVEELTTENVDDPTNEAVWKKYKKLYNKTFDMTGDDEKIARTIFVRRVQYLLDGVKYSLKGHIVLDDRLDTKNMPIDEDRRELIYKDWLKLHRNRKLNDKTDYLFALHIIFYNHRELLKRVNQPYEHDNKIEKLLFWL